MPSIALRYRSVGLNVDLLHTFRPMPLPVVGLLCTTSRFGSISKTGSAKVSTRSIMMRLRNTAISSLIGLTLVLSASSTFRVKIWRTKT